MILQDAVETARQVARTVVAEETAHLDQPGQWPARSLTTLRQKGLGGLVVPTKAGGLGLGLQALARVCEELAFECGSTAICYGMHCVGAAVIAAKATEAQVERYLVPIARGEHLTTLALSEPGTGAHFYLPQVRLQAVPGEGYRLRGSKSFVTNGGHADSYVVSTAPADPAAPPGRFSCVLVPRDAPGVRFEATWAGWGMRANSAHTLHLEDAVIPPGHLLGSEGDEIWYVFHVVTPFFITAMAGTYLGVAARAVEEAREALQQRLYAHSASTPAHQPVLQHRLGELWARVERTRSLIYRAAEKGEGGAPDALPALCSAKAEVADCAERVVADAMTLMGGRAYGVESRIQRLYRDARAAHVMAPTTDMLRTWTGRSLLGLPLLGD